MGRQCNSGRACADEAALLEERLDALGPAAAASVKLNGGGPTARAAASSAAVAAAERGEVSLRAGGADDDERADARAEDGRGALLPHDDQSAASRWLVSVCVAGAPSAHSASARSHRDIILV